MMLMKKITFNALLNHKAHNYKPMQVEVKKVIHLYGKNVKRPLTTLFTEYPVTSFDFVWIHYKD